MYNYHRQLFTKSNIENSISPTASIKSATEYQCGYGGTVDFLGDDDAV